MGFFGEDDPFDSIVREFFGETRPARTSSSRDYIKSEREERVVDYIEEENKIYFVFELFGYSKNDLEVEAEKGFVKIIAKRKDFENVQDYLIPKLKKGIEIRKEVPNLKVKKYEWTFNNGILEVKVEIK